MKCGQTTPSILIILLAFMASLTVTAQSTTGFVAVQRDVLLNDLTVIGVPSQGESFGVHLALKHGALFDPPQKQGTAYLTARYIAHRLLERLRLDLAQDWPADGPPPVTLDTRVTADGTYFRLQGPARHLSVAGRALSEILPDTPFDDAAIGLVKMAVIEEIRSLEGQPCYVARQRLRRDLMQPSPYAFPPGGNSHSLAAIQPEDLIRFYRRLYMPNRAILLISSPLSAKDLRIFATRFFGLWTKQEAPEYNFLAPAPADLPPGRLLRSAVSDGCCIAVGAETLPLKHDDAPALDVLRRIVQQRLAGPVVDGQGYVVTVENEGLLKTGYFIITATGPAAAAAPVTTIIHEAIQDLIKGGCSPSEFLAAKNDVLENFLSLRADPSRWNRLLLTAEFYRLGIRYPDLYPDQLDSLIREDITYLAGKYLGRIISVVVSPDTLSPDGFPVTMKQEAASGDSREP